MSIELAFEAVGNGPSVVILHGLFGAGRNWTRIAEALGTTHRVYLPDARNHGASPRGQTMSYSEMALDVLTFIEREQLDRPLVIGHSMGGKTAMTLALEHAQAISGVAVIDIAPEAYGDQFSPYMTTMRGLGRSKPVDVAMRHLWRHDERFDWRLNLLAVAMCMPDLCGFQQQLMHRRYEGPALFLSGGDSDYVRPESHTGIARMFPRAQLERIADAGHWVHADQPDALLRALRSWLCAVAPQEALATL